MVNIIYVCKPKTRKWIIVNYIVDKLMLSLMHLTKKISVENLHELEVQVKTQRKSSDDSFKA